MRIALRELEEARRDPIGFIQQRLQQAPIGPRKRGYFMYWRDAVLRWHKEDGHLTAIRHDLEMKLEEKFRSPVKITDTMSRFDEYVHQYQDSGFYNQRVRMDLKVPLPQILAKNYEIYGEISRFDRKNDYTYVACLIASKNSEWQSQLRMPLIQTAVASYLNLEPEDVSVAVYTFEDSSYQEFFFTNEQLEQSQNELADLLLQLN